MSPAGSGSRRPSRPPDWGCWLFRWPLRASFSRGNVQGRPKGPLNQRCGLPRLQDPIQGHLGLFQRLKAAFLAMAFRSSLDRLAARAFPPFRPPSLPISCITFRRSATLSRTAETSLNGGLVPSVTCWTTENAATLGSSELDRLG